MTIDSIGLGATLVVFGLWAAWRLVRLIEEAL